jgi:hypothetical protein
MAGITGLSVFAACGSLVWRRGLERQVLPRCGTRLAEAGIEASVGSSADSCDIALAETTRGL